MNDATRRTNWIVICPRRGMKQWVEQLYTVSIYITNIQCTNTWLLLRYYCIPIVILNNVQGSLIKILGHSLFALCLCLFTLVRLFQTRASTNVNNLGAALHFWYGTSSNMVVWSDGLNGSWSLAGKAILLAMHVIVAERPGILLTNSRGWNFMSEIGLARAGSNEASRQNNNSNAWFYCFYQKCYFFRSDSLTHHDSLTHLTHKTSVLSIFTNLFVHQVWMGSFWPTKPITVLGVSTFKRGSELASGPKLETVGSIFSRF